MKKIFSILSLFFILLSPMSVGAKQFKKATLINYLTGTKIVVSTENEAQRGFGLGYHLYDSKMLGYNVVTNYQTNLSASISSSQTTIPVATVKTKDGHTLTMDDLGDYVYLSIETGSLREEIVSCTGISGSSFTGCSRGLSFYGTSTTPVSANQYAHSAGSKVVMSNVHYVYQGFVDRQSDETIGGIKTFSSNTFFQGLVDFLSLPTTTTTAPTTDNQLVNKKYVDETISAGAPIGSETVAGIFMGATKEQMASGTATSTYAGFDYNLVLLNKNLSATSSANSIVMTNEYGLINSSILGGVIDPDNITSQSKATLYGGTDIDLENFQDLASTTNDGIFVLNIDENEYDISLDLNKVPNDESTVQSFTNATYNGEAFTLTLSNDKDFIIQNISLINSDGGCVGRVIIKEDDSGGDVIARSDLTSFPNAATGTAYFTGDNEILLENGNDYYFYVEEISGTDGFIKNNVSNKNYYIMKGRELSSPDNLSNLTEYIQSVITTLPRTEIFEYNTDHFEISSGGRNRTISITASSTGTDISGAGYLDLFGGTFIAGSGEDYKLVKTDEDGKINTELMTKQQDVMLGNISYTSRALNTVYQNDTDKIKLIVANIYTAGTLGADSTNIGMIGETNNPSIVISQTRNKAGAQGGSYIASPIFLIVKPNWYYKIYNPGSDSSIVSWFECDLI